MGNLYDGNKRRSTDYGDNPVDKWHVGKEIPLALIFAIIVQTGGWIWWAATLSTKVEDLSLQIAALSADKYTATDAKKDAALYMSKFSDNDRRLENIERKMR